MRPWIHPNTHTHARRSYIVVFARQGSAVPEMDDPSDKHSLLHHRLQRTGALLHDAAHLQRHCERDGPVPVLLQRPQSGGWQDVSGDLCVRPRYNSVYLCFLCFFLLLLRCTSKNAASASFKRPTGGPLPVLGPVTFERIPPSDLRLFS